MNMATAPMNMATAPMNMATAPDRRMTWAGAVLAVLRAA